MANLSRDADDESLASGPYSYAPPWKDISLIGIAGSSGSGKTSLALAIVAALNLPWVVILSMDSFYKPLNPEESKKAFRNEYDFDSPDAIDFDLLVEKLKDLKEGRHAEIPVYSFSKHAREANKSSSIYSPHVLVLEGIFALYDQRVLDLLDIKIFAEADADVCLSRRILRDVRDRGRDVDGCIKQWLAYVKPNFIKYVEPQREVSDIIIPRGIENRVAIDMIVQNVQRLLGEKSKAHRAMLRRLGKQVEDEPLSTNVSLLEQTPQIKGMNTILQHPLTEDVDFTFYFDRLCTLLIEKALDNLVFEACTVTTSLNLSYHGLEQVGEISAMIVLRGGSCFETGLRRVLPDCMTGRILIQTNYRTGEPELHFNKLPKNIASHARVLILDPQMSSGGAALMAVQILLDHGVKEDRIVFVTYLAGKIGVKRLLKVYPSIKMVVCKIGDDYEDRWIEKRYFGC